MASSFVKTLETFIVVMQALEFVASPSLVLALLRFFEVRQDTEAFAASSIVGSVVA